VSIQERKIRKSGNSVVLTLSKELLEKIGIQENDYVFVDEDKLAAAITKKSLPSEQELEINRLIDQSFSQYEEMYKELANHWQSTYQKNKS